MLNKAATATLFSSPYVFPRETLAPQFVQTTALIFTSFPQLEQNFLVVTCCCTLLVLVKPAPYFGQATALILTFSPEFEQKSPLSRTSF